MKCPMCGGTGGWRVPVLWDGAGGGPLEDCDLCGGTGTVSAKRWWLYQAEVQLRPVIDCLARTLDTPLGRALVDLVWVAVFVLGAYVLYMVVVLLGSALGS